MHTVNLLSSAAFVFIIRKEWFLKAVRIGAVLIITSMILFYALPGAQLKTIAAVISSVAIGCVNICILIPFAFTLNNTEKLYAVISSNILIQLISLIKEHSPSSLAESIMSFAILIFSLSAVLFFRLEASIVENRELHAEKPAMSSRVYLSLLFNCAIVILCKGVGKGILNIAAASAGPSVLTGYYIGGLAGCLIYMLVYVFTKKHTFGTGALHFPASLLVFCATHLSLRTHG